MRLTPPPPPKLQHLTIKFLWAISEATRERRKGCILSLDVAFLSWYGQMYRHRHLMLDLAQLLPHAKKDFKLDTKSDRGVINEVSP